jgi:hypothetical protein
MMWVEKIYYRSTKICEHCGKGVSSTEFGATWFYPFKRSLDYPAGGSGNNNIKLVNLLIYNTLILTDGDYNFSEDQQNKIGSGLRMVEKKVKQLCFLFYG